MHKKFNYKSIDELKSDIESLGFDLGISDDFSVFSKPVKIGNHTLKNVLVTHPMEGGDSDEQGAPTNLTFRKYELAAKGGSGLIWLEAVSVNQEGRSNKGQLYINDKTLSKFKDLVQSIHEASSDGKPLTILQLNHSGRYSKPKGKSAPIIASYIPELDERINLSPEHPIVTDEYLDSVSDDFVKASLLAKEAGFDGVDIKACHGYLLHELLSCFNRSGKYGGSFDNRTRLMLDIIDHVRKAIPDPDFLISSRINLYDALPRTLGWGMDSKDFTKVDLAEPIKLASEFIKRGVTLINTTMGNPYFIPHINRPYDQGAYIPNEHPLEGVYRLIHNTKLMQKAIPEAQFVGAGYSWLREFSPYVAAWVLKNGGASLIGYGRLFIAYPDFAKDILSGGLQKRKICISCSKCSMLKREIGTCGCVIRDGEYYLQMYTETFGKGLKE